jgi:long-chain acyl-CoA synthetase
VGKAPWWLAVCIAAEVRGVKVDDKLSLGGPDLVLQRRGCRTRAVFKSTWRASRAAEDRTRRRAREGTAANPLNLLRTLSADQLAVPERRSRRGPAPPPSCAVEAQAVAPWHHEAFKGKEKDIVTLTSSTADEGKWNGRKRTFGRAVNRALTRIWIGDKPVQADLKKALLGG